MIEARDVDLLGLYWTTSGPVEVGTGREWSLFDFADRCAQAARVGFHGIGIWHADPTRRLLFEAAGALNAHHIKVGNIPGTPCPVPQVTERFAELCADAARHTGAKIVYEFMPFDANVRSIQTALEVVQGAGAANGGVAIDTWHMGKLGIAPDDLRQIPPPLLSWVELSDGQLEDMPDLVDETVNHRRLPGEGEFGVHRYVEVCQDMGYEGPWGVEVLSRELRSLPMEQIFDRAYDTTIAQFRTGKELP